MYKGLEILFSNPANLLNEAVYWRTLVPLLILGVLYILWICSIETINKKFWITMGAAAVGLYIAGVLLTSFFIGQTYDAVKTLVTQPDAAMTIQPSQTIENFVVEKQSSQMFNGQNIERTTQAGRIIWGLIPLVGKQLEKEGIKANWSYQTPSAIPLPNYSEVLPQTIPLNPGTTIIATLLACGFAVLVAAAGILVYRSHFILGKIGVCALAVLLIYGSMGFATGLSYNDSIRQVMGLMQSNEPFTITILNNSVIYTRPVTYQFLGKTYKAEEHVTALPIRIASEIHAQ